MRTAAGGTCADRAPDGPGAGSEAVRHRVFLALVLCAVLVLPPVLFAAQRPGWRPAAVGAGLWLVWRRRREYRTGAAQADHLDLVDGLAVFTLGLPSGAQASIGVLFALAYCRTVLADGRRLAVGLTAYLSGFLAAALLVPAGTPIALGQVLGTCAGLLISSYLMFFVQSTLLAREGALRAQNAELAAKETFLAAVLDNVADGVIACTPDGRLTVFNRASRRLHGLAPSAAAPATLPLAHGIRHPQDGRLVAREDVPLMRALRGEHVRDMEVLLATPGGNERSVVASGQPLYDRATDRPLGAVLTLHDVTERRRAEAALADQSVHDPLTGLANRVLLLDRVEHALVRGSHQPTPMSLLFLDVDHFKKVNDTLGHAAGDAVLCTVAERLREVLRPDDTAARLGGDEFAILLEDTAATQAAEIAGRILAAVHRPVELGGRMTSTGVSIGVAESSPDTDAGTLLRHADLAMYAAKRAGRGRVEMFRPAMQARMVDQVSMEDDLHGAVERGEMSLVFQPVVCLRSGAVYGAEALLRWNHPQRGPVNPARFIRVAEDSGLIDDLGRWVLVQACREAPAWQAMAGRDLAFHLAVNLSPRQLADPLLVDAVRTALADNALPPSALTLEITESALMGESLNAAHVLEQLHGLGVGLSLDDFGTGYSSLGRLRAFPFTSVKIDQTFIAEIDSGTTAVVEAALALAGSLGLDTVGEGIETPTQLAALQDRGCVGGQGHLFSPPVTAEDFTVLLARSRAGELHLLPGLRRVGSVAS